MNRIDAMHELLKIEHGFKPFEDEARKIWNSSPWAEALAGAEELLASGHYQIRCVGIFILGFASSRDRSLLGLLKERARLDASWQVQEIIAKAFDGFCRDSGYENALPEIREWLGDAHPNVCRAVTEGLRIWTGRPYFKEHPQEAISLISQHRQSDSEYLRKSVGNALRDIGKKHPELVQEEISGWDLSDSRTAFTCRYAVKKQ
ncbi:DNA alkylation repair protein [uncultured Flavobacterium sp.]|uniref:DNA alkylation repair protein n=1 Tax=uncultured Flavobacterium sp. TaxID=165435 RepID=UPI0025E94E01|nr:DNA alkylation repair protein [uncultured Flavobacterium sp.]